MTKIKKTKNNSWEGLTDHNFTGLQIEMMFNHTPVKIIKENNKPNIIKLCPNCESNKINFNYKTEYGHGDSGYTNAKIQCNSCSLSIGNKSDWGRPSNETELELWELWNKTANKLKNE